MKLYVGIDLHSNNSYVSVVAENDKVVFTKKLSNDNETILHALQSYKTDIEGVVVESTYNWYWLADALIEAGYKVHLANTTAIQQYNGMKHTNDKSATAKIKAQITEKMAMLIYHGLLQKLHITQYVIILK